MRGLPKVQDVPVTVLVLLGLLAGNVLVLMSVSKGVTSRCNQDNPLNIAKSNSSRLSPLSTSGLAKAKYSSLSTSSKLHANLPELFIYRRSRKSGSSSMLAALLELLQPLGYEATYYNPGFETNHSLNFQFGKLSARRVFVAEHNAVTRAFHPRRSAVIADTVRNGYEQLTSLCRYTRGVAGCGSDMRRCLESKWALSEINFKWAGESGENADNYIDLPLSAKHPSLSTSVLKIALPMIADRINVHKYHVRKTHCPRDDKLLAVYNKLYAQMDRDIEKLKVRMLILTGYPYELAVNARNVSVDDMLDAAEAQESKKYAIVLSEEDAQAHNGISQQQRQLLTTLKKWTKDSNGNAVLTNRRSI